MTQKIEIHNPSSNTWKIVGIGVIGLFLLSKIKGGGQSITESIGSGVGDVVQSSLSGVGDVVQGAIGGVGKGVGNVFTKAGAGILAPAVDTMWGGGTAAKWTKTGQQVIDDEGLGVVFWTKDRIAQYMQPKATKIVEGSGYKTASGLTYIDPGSQGRAATIQQLLQSAVTPGDAAYMLAVQEGRDVSHWNMSGLSDSFKNTLNG